MNLDEIKKEYLANSDVAFSEFLRSEIDEGEREFTDEEIKELLSWSGDDEFVTVDDIRSIVLGIDISKS